MDKKEPTVLRITVRLVSGDAVIWSRDKDKATGAIAHEGNVLVVYSGEHVIAMYSPMAWASVEFEILDDATS